MKKITYSLLIFFLSILFIKCERKETSPYNNLMELLPQRAPNAIIVIIPKLGCSTCYNSAKQFVSKHYSDKNTYFIAVGFKSKKELVLEFSTRIVQSNNFIWDKERKTLKWKMVSNNPAFFYFKNTNLINTGKILPSNEQKTIIVLKRYIQELKDL